jgi:hypothetical protein
MTAAVRDKYIQQAVRLENLKRGEARKVVRLLEGVHDDLLKKLDVGTDWSKKRYEQYTVAHSQALDQVFNNKILPDLNESGLEFTLRNIDYHNSNLVDAVTGQYTLTDKALRQEFAEWLAERHDYGVTTKRKRVASAMRHIKQDLLKAPPGKMPTAEFERFLKDTKPGYVPGSGRPAGDPGEPISTANVSASQIHSAAIAEPLKGRLMEEWVKDLSKKEIKQVNAQLRQAWIEGEAVNKAVKRLQPILKQTRNNLTAITRTYYGHLAAKTRDAVWQANSDLIDYQLWDSILDGRTTIEICAPRDQLKYTLGGKPIGHNLSYMGGPGQAHWQCRSMSYPVIKGQEPEAERQAVGAGKNYERGDNKTRTGRVRTNSKRARDRGLLKETKVKPGQTYEDWLKKQPKAFQEDVLGVARAKAFRDGTWKLGGKFKAVKPIKVKDYKPPPPPKPKVKARAVKPGEQKPIEWGSDDAGKWSQKSFAEAPRELQENVEARLKEGLNVMTNDSRGAFYRGGTSTINMPKAQYSIGMAKAQSTWRHEMGHALDHQVGKRFDLSKGARAAAAAKKTGPGAPNIDYASSGDHLHKRFRSSGTDFTKAIAADAKVLEKANQANFFGKDAEVYSDIIDDFRGKTPAQQVTALKKQAKAVGVDYDDFMSLMSQESRAYLKPDKWSTEADIAHIAFQNNVRTGRALKAVEMKDSEVFFQLVTGRGRDSYYRLSLDQGNMTYFSDMVGASTKNSVCGYGRFPGHETSYYNEYSENAPTEVFANLTAMLGSPKHKEWVPILEKFVPNTVKLYMDIIGL